MKRGFGFGLVAVALLAVACGGRTARRDAAAAAATTPATTVAAPAAAVEPTRYTYEVVAEYPHDKQAYTQGLYWRDGFFYEGTGGNGRSELRRVEPASGRVLQRTRLDRQYFGEGIEHLDGLIYQLTWVTGKAYVYDEETFRLVRTFVYDGEGWGLATDGEYLYMSDGSDRISVRDPKTFGIVRTFDVKSKGYPVDQLNELEWIDGLIWANRYLYDEVVMIDPQNGQVVGIIDFSDLQAPEDIHDGTDVLNGIAYDAETGAVYVTGKNWAKVYRVKIVEAE